MPRMNAIMERWVETCRHELLDRTLIWNQRHLLHALREFEQFYISHRPHQGIGNARPLHPLPEPSRPRTGSPASTYVDATASAASSTNTNMPRDQHG
jgi:putative transposase